MSGFLPAGQEVPDRCQGWVNEPAVEAGALATFVLHPLTVDHLLRDYEAVMASRERLVGLFGPDDPWPAADLSLTQDLIDLGWHQREFQLRRSFAYTVLTFDEARCLGCVYIEPSAKRGYDAQVFYWARVGTGALETALGRCVERWLDESWWFEGVAYPGRAPGWAEWQALADREWR